MGLCSVSGTGRDVEVQSRISQPDQSEKGGCTGVCVVEWHVGALAGKEDCHVRGRGSKGRLAAYKSFHPISEWLRVMGARNLTVKEGSYEYGKGNTENLHCGIR